MDHLHTKKVYSAVDRRAFLAALPADYAAKGSRNASAMWEVSSIPGLFLATDEGYWRAWASTPESSSQQAIEVAAALEEQRFDSKRSALQAIKVAAMHLSAA